MIGVDDMKHLVRILSVLLVLCLLAGISVSVSAVQTELAEVALDRSVPDEVHTEISYDSGVSADVSAAPMIEAIDSAPYRDSIESYEVFVDETPVLGVEFTRFYSAEFIIPETQKKVFLAGLTADNIAETQRKIVASYTKADQGFSIEDLSFIDAEKRKGDPDDDNLCWAAACANTLSYTGWAEMAGFETEDDVFDAFVSAFTDDGNVSKYGYGWFFNGVDTYNKLYGEGARVKNYGESGKYLPDYAYDRVTGSADLCDDYEKLASATELLREGCGVALGVEVFVNNTHAGGHEVTMWGAVFDEAYEPDQPAYYDMLFITDSDSDKYNADYTDRRQAKNEMDLYKLSYFDEEIYGESTSTMSYFDGQNTCALYDIDWIIPYSEKEETESDELATKDKTTTKDIAISDVFLSNSTGGSYTDEFMLGDTVYINPTIKNVGDYAFSVSPYHTLRATISGTDFIYERNFSSNLRPGSYINSIVFPAEGLKKGDYTLTVSFDSDHQAEEAYYYNNIYTIDFSVVTDPKKYMTGDADDDWEITVLDATLIQKTLAMLIEDEDGRIAHRGNLYDELSILSATAIQKYLANYPIDDVSIGDIRSYETGE